MIAESRQCRYCSRPFPPSRFHPGQFICPSPDCQRRRRTDYHREKRQTDPEYSLVCQDSTRKWRAGNPDYQSRYRGDHPDYVDRNRRAQKRRDRKRRMRDLVKNNLALDLKSSAADVWLAGPELEDLVKNNLAISEVMIFQSVGVPGSRPDGSCKEHPAVFRSAGGL